MDIERCLVFILLVEHEPPWVLDGLVAHIHQAARLLARMLLHDAHELLAFFFCSGFRKHVNLHDDHFALACFWIAFGAANSASNSGKEMVWPRSGPVETMPILAPVSFSIKCKYSCACLGNLLKLTMPSVDFFQPGIFS